MSDVVFNMVLFRQTITGNSPMRFSKVGLWVKAEREAEREVDLERRSSISFWGKGRGNIAKLDRVGKGEGRDLERITLMFRIVARRLSSGVGVGLGLEVGVMAQSEYSNWAEGNTRGWANGRRVGVDEMNGEVSFRLRFCLFFVVVAGLGGVAMAEEKMSSQSIALWVGGGCWGGGGIRGQGNGAM